MSFTKLKWVETRKQEGISSRFTAVLCLLEVICTIERKNS